MKKKTTAVFYMLFLCMGNIIIYILDSGLTNWDGYLKWISLYSIINLVIMFIGNKKFGIKYISAYSILILLTFIYCFGQIWLMGLGIDMEKSSFTLTHYKEGDIITATIVNLIFIYVINISALVSYKYIVRLINRKKAVKKEVENRKKKALYYIGVILLVFSVCALTYNDLQQIIVALASSKNGYADSYLLGRNNPLVYLATYLYPIPIFAILFSTGGKQMKKVAIMYGLGRPILMILFVGSRMSYMPMLVALMLYFSIYSKRKISSKKILVGGILIAFLYSFVAATRNGISDITSIMDYITTNNIIVNILQEMGGTAISMILLIVNLPVNLKFGFGKSYISSFLTLFPGGNSFIGELDRYRDMGVLLNNYFHKGSGLGGFYIAEMYYNFGMFALLIAPFAGILFIYISEIISRKDESSPFMKMAGFYIFYIAMIFIRAQVYELLFGLKILVMVYILYLGIDKYMYMRKSGFRGVDKDYTHS